MLQDHRFTCLQGPFQEWDGTLAWQTDKIAVTIVAVTQWVWFPACQFYQRCLKSRLNVRLPSFPHWHYCIWCTVWGSSGGVSSVEHGCLGLPSSGLHCLCSTVLPSSIMCTISLQASPWRHSYASPSTPMSWARCRQRMRQASLSVL